MKAKYNYTPTLQAYQRLRCSHQQWLHVLGMLFELSEESIIPTSAVITESATPFNQGIAQG